MRSGSEYSTFSLMKSTWRPLRRTGVKLYRIVNINTGLSHGREENYLHPLRRLSLSPCNAQRVSPPNSPGRVLALLFLTRLHKDCILLQHHPSSYCLNKIELYRHIHMNTALSSPHS